MNAPHLPSADPVPPPQKRANLVFRGFWMTTAVLLGLVGLTALTSPNSKAQEFGVMLFVILLPLISITLLLAALPVTRRFALGMLLSSGAMLLFSFALCTVRR